jgi:hypothetical protein
VKNSDGLGYRVNLVKDAIPANAYPKQIFTAVRECPGRPRIIGEEVGSIQHLS